MAFSENLANRIRQVLHDDRTVTEKKMFGGLAFLVNGNMCCGIVGDELMVRVGPEAYHSALEHQHASEMNFTGKALKGFIYVSPEGVAADNDLAEWVRRGASFALTLPAKS